MDHDLVVQLHLFRRQQRRQSQYFVMLRGVVGDRRRRRLRHRDARQQRGQVRQRGAERQAHVFHRACHRQHRAGIARDERIENAHQVRGIDRAKHGTHRAIGDRACAVCNRLVGQGQRIAHAAGGSLCQQPQRRLFGRDPFFGEHTFEVADDLRLRHLL